MSRCVLAVDLGGTKCSAAIVERSGRIVRCLTVAVDRTSAAAPIRQICQLARELAGDIAPGKAFRAAAVAVPGLVRRNGTVWAPNLPGWERMPLGRRLRLRLGIPVAVESDRTAGVLGEAWRGAARGKSDAILVMIGTGIGAGILSGGRVIRGAHELSGCAGWMTVTRENVRKAWQIGELEALVAGPAIARIALERLRKGEKSRLSTLDPGKITAREVAAAARRLDPLAREIFLECGELLGRAIANLVSLFDPDIVVIGGGLAKAGDLYMPSLRRAMVKHAQPLAAERVKVRVSNLGPEANLIGCARLAWELARVRVRGPRK